MKTKIWLALITIYIVWGSTYLAIRFVVETIPPFLSAGMRFLISGLILLIWRYLVGDAFPTKRQWKSAAIIGTLLLLGGNGLVSFAEQFVPSGISALIISSVPIWMVLIEALRPGGVKPNWQVILGLMIGFGGIFLLIGPDELISNTSSLNPLGLGALFLAAFLWSTGSIYSRSADLPSSALMTTGAEMLSGSVVIFTFSGVIGEWNSFDITAVSTHSWLGLLYLIAIGSLVGFASYVWLLKNVPVSLATTYAYVNPLVAVLLGVWFANEVFNSRILIAGLTIISSVVLINQTKSTRKDPHQDQASATVVE